MAITKEVEERLNRDIKATQSLMIRNSTDYGLRQSLLGDSPFLDQTNMKDYIQMLPKIWQHIIKHLKKLNQY